MAALLLVLFASDRGAGTDIKACKPAPAMHSDFPDPSIFAAPALGAAVFAYGTNIVQPGSGALLNIPVSRSADAALTHWSAPADALPRLPAWAQPTVTWAPAVVHRRGGPYRLYFAARYGDSNRPCIGVALSDRPEGPFAPTSERRPLVCPLSAGGAIDPSVFRDDDGDEYLLWKTDANCCSGVPTLYIQKLAADGLSLSGAGGEGGAPWRLGDAVALIHRDQAWEDRVVEAPTLVKHAGRYFLFYSGGYYASDRYAVGYASSDHLLGPYSKAPAPILNTANSGLLGPGGQDVFTGPDGASRIAFHAWVDEGASRKRALYLAKLVWNSNRPTVKIDCPGA